MNQASPNNRTFESEMKLSIQISVSGFSFYVSQNGQFLYGSRAQSYDFEAIIGNTDRFSEIYIGWSCDSVMMIPGEVFDPAYCRDYIKAANFNDPSSEVLYNDTFDIEMVALWTVDRALLELLENVMPNAYHYHNLQLDLATAKTETVKVAVNENNANVLVRTNEGLYAAETINFFTPEDLLFFVAKLNSIDKFSRHSLEFIAENAEEYRRLFEPQFPQSEFLSDNNTYHKIILRCE